MKNETEQKKEHVIQWHPAFFAAIQLIFRNEKVHMEFEAEHTLNTKPLLVDVLIIKKPTNEMLKSSLGHIFRGHNIIEYKSPMDQLGVDAYFKAYAYACLYKASAEHEDSIKLEDVTITLVRDRKPEKLLAHLKEQDYSVTNPYPGIYYVKNCGMFDTQIVVGRELQDGEQVWLKAMAPDAGAKTLTSFMQMAANELNQGWKNLMESVLEVVFAVNQNEVAELKGGDNMCEALREIMKDEIEEELNKAKKQSIEEGFKQGIEQGIEQTTIKAIQMGLTDEQIIILTGIKKEELDELKKKM